MGSSRACHRRAKLSKQGVTSNEAKVGVVAQVKERKAMECQGWMIPPQEQGHAQEKWPCPRNRGSPQNYLVC